MTLPTRSTTLVSHLVARRGPLWAAALSLSLLLASNARLARAEVHVANFVEETLHGGNGMIAIEFGPGDRMYVAEKAGRVLVFQPDGAGGYQPPTELADFTGEVYSAIESGLLGMVLDPDFAQNRHIYLFYSTAGDQRLVRITATQDYNGMQAGSATPLLTGLPRAVDHHNAGDIQFRPGEPDAIYVSIGDDGEPARAQELDSYHGKILRLDKVTGAGLADNPFYDGDVDSVRSRVWALGMRNPFRFTFHPELPVDDVLYVSENGDSTDKMAWVRAGSNGGWSLAGDSAFLEPDDGEHRVLWTEPATVTGIAIARGGPFSDLSMPGSDVLLLANGLQGIRRFRLTGDQRDAVVPLDGGQRFASGYLFAVGADMTFGPDGALYFSLTQTNDSQGFGTLYRIRFVGGDPPDAAFTSSPNPPRGPVPLGLSFSDASSDPDGNIVRWRWDFGDGESSDQQNPSHVYDAPGDYLVRLRVTDDTGLSAVFEAQVEAYRQVELGLELEVIDARTRQEPPLGTNTELRVYRANGTTPLPFSGGSGADGNALSVTGGALSTQLALQVPDDAVVVSVGESPGDGVHAAYRALTVSGGTQRIAVALSDMAIRGRVHDLRESGAVVDLGVGRDGQPYAVAGGRDFLSGSGESATGVAHRLVTDALGYYYVPVRSGDAGDFTLDLVVDTGRATYTSVRVEAPLGAGELLERDIALGLLRGGRDCDDLGGIEAASEVDYVRDIQPIWDRACTGCHSATPDRNGGLDLVGDSMSRLVGVDSAFVPGLKIVEPGYPELSYLIEKINCADPQHGTRMRPSDAMPLAEQARVRDWIASLPPRPGVRPPPEPVEPVDGGASGGTDGGGGSSGGSGGRGGSGGLDAGALDAGTDAGAGGGESPAAARGGDGCSCGLAGDRGASHGALAAGWLLGLAAWLCARRRAGA